MTQLILFSLPELGSKLQQEARERAENERLGAVRAAEQAIREEAERLKVTSFS